MTETQLPPPRIDPPFVGSERLMLESWLEYHRATLLMKCAGLTDPQLKLRSAPQSSLTLLGLVRHMADVERGWFQRTLAGQDVPPIFYSAEYPDGDFDLTDRADVTSDFATYADAVAACRMAAAAEPDLEAVGAGLRQGREVSLRWIYLHMIEEYARHNGHADLLRERIDGSTGD